MAARLIDGTEAWSVLARDAEGQWANAGPRFAEDPFPVRHRAAFTLGIGSRFFCIGSCFARNVEEHLIYRGAEVLSKRVVSPKSEWVARANGFLNKFTTHSMLQEIRWLETPPARMEDHLLETGLGWRDLQLAPELGETSLERALERRRYLAEDYFPRLRQADVVLMTLGLNEVWRDGQTGLHLNAPPSLWNVRREPGRYSVEVTGVDENVAALEEIRERLKAMNSDLKIVVTVSPVPMRATFSGQDVVVANTLSKSTLRAAAEEFRRAHDDVDYFPSYEMVTLSRRDFAFAADQMHVTDRIVGSVMARFLEQYCGVTEPAPEGFVELHYLDANPDVEDRVRTGELSSGFEHWVKEGRAENRPLREAELSDRARRAGT